MIVPVQSLKVPCVVWSEPGKRNSTKRLRWIEFKGSRIESRRYRPFGRGSEGKQTANARDLDDIYCTARHAQGFGPETG